MPDIVQTFLISIYIASFLIHLFSLFGDRCKDWLIKDFTVSPWLIFMVSGSLIFWYLTFIGLSNQGPEKVSWIFVAYLLIPTGCIYLAEKLKLPVGWPDLFVASLFWLPFDFRLVTKNWGTQYSFGFTAMSALILAIYSFTILRRLEETKINFHVGLQDIKRVITYFSLLAAIVIPLGFIMEFLHLGLDTKNFFLIAIAVFLLTALPEEFLFRGVIQNAFQRIITNQQLALIITSIIFGFAHLNNKGGKFWPPADWNWKYILMATIAGYAYGLLFMKSRSIWPSVGLHGSVDIIWHTFFDA